MNIATPVGSEIKHVDFNILSAKEIRDLSAKKITSPSVFDNLGHPINGGLYDLALGAFLRNLCATCGLDEKFCPGHQGHIDLPIPIYNPLFFLHLFNFLRMSCIYCHSFKLTHSKVHHFECKLRLIQYGLLKEATALDSINLQNDGEMDEAIEEENSEDANTENTSKFKIKKLISAKQTFTDNAIQNALQEGKTSNSGVTSPTIQEIRKRLIIEFYHTVSAKKKCENCSMFNPNYRKDGYSKIFEASLTEKQTIHNRIKGINRNGMITENKQSSIPETNEDEEIDPDASSLPNVKYKAGSKYVLSMEVRNILRSVFKNEQAIIQLIFNSRPSITKKKNCINADIFFLHAIIVPPTRFRLPSKLGDQVHENAQNEILSKILSSIISIKEINERILNFEKDKAESPDERKLLFNRLMNGFVTLQNNVNGLIDSAKNQNLNVSRDPPPGVKQILEKKEGLFRKHMMGKRVNYAARSVISPDPLIETNQVAVPPVFAKKLTFPEPVTSYNASQLRQYVINGPEKWPGAVQIQNEDGSLISLIGMSLEQRKALANQLTTPSLNTPSSIAVNKKVYRHLNNNDIVLMNRQPTLHKASMMGHKVRVLQGQKTIRIHYANTGAYNADFDGDEMNMHFPQSQMARSEAFNLANTDSQYLTPTSGSPVRGLIQDHLSAGVWLTNKESFFTKEKYQYFIYNCLRPEDGHTNSNRIKTVIPAILKPVPLWTGKQIISTILLNIKPLNTPGINLTSENKIKNEYWGNGSKENTVLFKDGELLCGILDKSQYGATKYGIIHALHEIYGPDVSSNCLSVFSKLFTTFNQENGLTCGMDDLRLTPEGDEWRKDILKETGDLGRLIASDVANLSKDVSVDDPELLKRLEEISRDANKIAVLDNSYKTSLSGIKSRVDKKCVPDGTMKKFPSNAMQMMSLSGAKGTPVNVSQIMCLLGQQELEGKRVPLMVSGKSLPSFPSYETSVRAGGFIKQRFYSGLRPQEYYFHCMAGREGLIDTAVKTANSGYLQRCLIKQLEGVHVAYDNTVRNSDGTLIEFFYGGDSIDVTKESYMRQFKFCLENYDAFLEKYSPGDAQHLIDFETAARYSRKVMKQLDKNSGLPPYKQDIKYDPVINLFNPSKYLGSVSEEFQSSVNTFMEENPKLFSKKSSGGLSTRKFRAFMQLKYMKSLINAGEPVGIIAGQSVGEPSTQMTLNTFHFAGHGAANVTLGIPRLREIVMTASTSIKTPQMTLPILDDITDEQADAFRRSVDKVCLSQLIDKVTVVESTGVSADNIDASRSYNIHITFYTNEEYGEEYDVSQNDLEKCIIHDFLKVLETNVSREVKKQKKTAREISKPVSKSKTETKDFKADKHADVDADTQKERSKGKQSTSYDDPDDEELEIIKKGEATSEEEYDSNSSDSSSGSGSDSDSDSESENEDENKDENEKKSSIKKHSKVNYSVKSTDAKERESSVISSHNLISQFNFDDKYGEWCEFTLDLNTQTEKLLMLQIVEEVCHKVVVREIEKISGCYRPSVKSGQKRVFTTAGV
ncbi:DNA-directed RNA polymerase I core subunit RPA190, partial [Ascoidea rubescens DSM 1968]